MRLWLADAAGVRVTRPRCPVTSGSRAGEESEDFADGRFLAGWLPQRHVGLDLVAVAAAVFLLHHVPGCGEIGDEAVGAAFSDVRVAAMSRSRTPGSWAMNSSTRAWLVRKPQLTTLIIYQKFSKYIASFVVRV